MTALFTPPIPDEEGFIRGFRLALGLPDLETLVLSTADRKAIRATQLEPPPHEAQIPLDQLAATTFPKLVVSGDWNAALEAVADRLTERLHAERAHIPGAGHSVQATGARFNARLEAFLEGVEGTVA
jgi:pimeloyl-ACP methyl ester carboxylesterase